MDSAAQPDGFIAEPLPDRFPPTPNNLALWGVVQECRAKGDEANAARFERELDPEDDPRGNATWQRGLARNGPRNEERAKRQAHEAAAAVGGLRSGRLKPPAGLTREEAVTLAQGCVRVARGEVRRYRGHQRPRQELPPKPEHAPTHSVPVRTGARRPRPRGRRPARAAARASARGGDSGDDGGSEPPPSRPCGCGCGRDLRDLAARARYATPSCRKRAQRDRDRDRPERVVERDVERLHRPADLVKERRCKPACAGEAVHFDEELGTFCFKCGRLKAMTVPPSVNGHAYRDPDPDVAKILPSAQLQSALGRVLVAEIRRDNWESRPDRKLSAKLRRTRKGDGWKALKERQRAAREAEA